MDRSSRAISAIKFQASCPAKLPRFLVCSVPRLSQELGRCHWNARVILGWNVFGKQAARTGWLIVGHRVSRAKTTTISLLDTRAPSLGSNVVTLVRLLQSGRPELTCSGLQAVRPLCWGHGVSRCCRWLRGFGGLSSRLN